MRIILYPVATEAAWPLGEFQFIHLMRSGAANCILIAFRVGRVRVSSRNGAHGIRKSSTLRLQLQCVGICRNLLQTGRANSKKFLSSSLAHCPASSAVLNTKQSRENRSLRPLSLSSSLYLPWLYVGGLRLQWRSVCLFIKVCIHYATGCTTGCTTGWTKRFEYSFDHPNAATQPPCCDAVTS